MLFLVLQLHPCSRFCRWSCFSGIRSKLLKGSSGNATNLQVRETPGEVPHGLPNGALLKPQSRTLDRTSPATPPLLHISPVSACLLSDFVSGDINALARGKFGRR